MAGAEKSRRDEARSPRSPPRVTGGRLHRDFVDGWRTQIPQGVLKTLHFKRTGYTRRQDALTQHATGQQKGEQEGLTSSLTFASMHPHLRLPPNLPVEVLGFPASSAPPFNSHFHLLPIPLCGLDVVTKVSSRLFSRAGLTSHSKNFGGTGATNL